MTIQVSQFEQQSLLRMPVGVSLDVKLMHFDPHYLQQQELVTRTAQGRATVYFFNLSNKSVVLRHYKRGGLMAKLSDDKFIFSSLEKTRCYEELNILAHLRKAKVNVPRAIAGKVYRKGLFYTADIISEVIPNTVELHELLQTQVVRCETWQAIGLEIKKMHDAQVFHGDINVKNVLLEAVDGAYKVHLLDFDKCEIRSNHHWKMNNLARFQRSLLKQSKKYKSYHYRQENWDQLLMAYKNEAP